MLCRAFTQSLDPTRPPADPHPLLQEHPWFKQDLPPGSLEYNDWALQLQITPSQSEEEVRAIIDQVGAGAGVPGRRVGRDSGVWGGACA